MPPALWVVTLWGWGVLPASGEHRTQGCCQTPDYAQEGQLPALTKNYLSAVPRLRNPDEMAKTSWGKKKKKSNLRSRLGTREYQMQLNEPLNFILPTSQLLKFKNKKRAKWNIFNSNCFFPFPTKRQIFKGNEWELRDFFFLHLQFY